MNINKNDTAVVVIDPQNDVLDAKGVSWDLVNDSRYKPFIEDGKTIVVSPHKVYGTQTNDLVL